jgi:hypothetical protein
VILPDGSKWYKSLRAVPLLWLDEDGRVYWCGLGKWRGHDRVPFCFLTVESLDLRRMLEVAGFDVAVPDDTAGRQHVQHCPDLSASRPLFPDVMNG